MKILSEYEKGFIEAAIDCDGSLSLIKDTYHKDHGYRKRMKRGYYIRITMSFSNNSLELLGKIQDILESNLTPALAKGTKNYNMVYRHTVLRWLLPQIELVIKEQRRKIALQILDLLETDQREPNREETLQDLVEKFLSS